ncbi:MAG: hypothetical protein AB8B55_07695 [Mariniblastus sp.]
MSTFMKSFGLAIAIGVTQLSSVGNAQDALDKELRAMANDHILPLVEKRGGGAMAVGCFSAASSVKGGSGSEVQMKLTSVLKDLQAKIDADEYRFEITGSYLPYVDPDSGLQGVKVIGRLVDAEDGTTLGEFPRFVFGPESVPRMLGLNVSTRGLSKPKMQSIAFRKALKEPKIFQMGSQIATSPTSPYSIELMVKQGNQYVPRNAVCDKKSRPFVQINQSEVYAVRLINHSKHEAAVKLTIDGVNVFHFSNQNPKPKHWVVPPKRNGKPGTTLIRGWDQSSGTSLEFKVTSWPSSAAALVKLQPSKKIGVISAAFSACWAGEKDRPRDEGRTRGTGFGDKIVDKKTMVSRQIGHVRDTISVRYEK